MISMNLNQILKLTSFESQKTQTLCRCKRYLNCIKFMFSFYVHYVFNPSFTKPFGTHTFYQGGGGGGEVADPCYLKNRCPHDVVPRLKFSSVLETSLNEIY